MLESGVEPNVMLWFLSVVILVFSLVLTMTGLFTVYFGSGKSRKIGAVLMLLGLVIGVFWVLSSSSYWMADEKLIDVPIMAIIKETIFYILAAAIGALIGLGAFLGAIMKA